MKKILSLSAVLLVVLLCGCRKYEKQNIVREAYPCSVGGITVYESPEKVAVSHSRVSHIIGALGLSDRIVAEGDYSDRDIPKIGSWEKINTDKVIESGASVLITDYELPLSEIEALSAGGVRLLVLHSPVSVEEADRLFCDVGRLFYGEGNTVYQPLRDKYFAALDELKARYFASSAVYITSRDLTDSDSLSRSVLGYIFDLSPSSEVSAVKPEYIFCGGKADRDFITSSAWYENTAASETGNVFSLPEDFFSSLTAEDFEKFSNLFIKE